MSQSDLMPGQASNFVAPSVRGKHILVTGGSAKEIIDGVRHYANNVRPEDHGHRVAAALAEQGAVVTLITSKTRLKTPKNVTVISATPDGREIISAADLAESCASIGAAQEFDIVLNLASVSSLKPANRAEHKLKVKTAPGDPVIMDVTANTDMLAALRRAGEGAALAGYNSRQEFQTDGLPATPWQTFIETHLHKDLVVIGEARQPASQLAQDLAGKKIIVSSGPVAETLTTGGDVITNFSSGVQGHEIACALADRGADVVLVAGPVTLPDPLHPSIRTVHVRSAKDMLKACMNELPMDVYVGVAAVADFGVDNPIDSVFAPGKTTPISLIQNPDILWTLGKHETQRPTVVIGFAAETRDLELYARGKLDKKGADAIFANLIESAENGQGSNRNHVYIVTRAGVHDCGETDKYQVGLSIADFIVSLSAKTPMPKGAVVSKNVKPT